MFGPDGIAYVHLCYGIDPVEVTAGPRISVDYAGEDAKRSYRFVAGSLGGAAGWVNTSPCADPLSPFIRFETPADQPQLGIFNQVD